MKLIIDPKIFEKYQGLNIGIIVARDIDNSKTESELAGLTRTQEQRIRAEFTVETLNELPNINVWRKTYSSFGAKPKDHKSSVENIYRVVLNGINLKSINTLVDAYNFISLKHMLPVGGEDLAKIEGDIHLTFAGESEPAVLLLGDKDPRPPHVEEVVYKDDISAICRRWNWREADRTKLMENTKNCVLVIEGLPPITRKQVESATNELKDLVEKYCRAKTTAVILDETNPECEL